MAVTSAVVDGGRVNRIDRSVAINGRISATVAISAAISAAITIAAVSATVAASMATITTVVPDVIAAESVVIPEGNGYSASTAMVSMVSSHLRSSCSHQPQPKAHDQKKSFHSTVLLVLR